MVVTNPCKSDPELKGMLDRLECVKTARVFRRWRASFLQQFEKYLEESGMECATTACDTFAKDMATFLKLTHKVNGFVDDGSLSVERSSVKARNGLNEWAKFMTEVIDSLDALIPSTIALEKNRGYNKFHMGAVLIRNDFAEYGVLTEVQEMVQHMRDVSLNQIADKQFLEKMDLYSNTLQKFCDVMADLGLYEVMLKCREFAGVEDNMDDLIFLDMKTGGIGEMDRGECLRKRILTSNNADDVGNEIFNESCTDPEAQEKVLAMIRESPKLGLGFGIKNNNYENELVDVHQAEKIKNMWGVTLRKTPKNKKGEEFVFVDKKNGAFGEISRKQCLETEMIHEVKDENGTIGLGEAEVDFEERGSLVEVIRSLLNLGIQ